VGGGLRNLEVLFLCKDLNNCEDINGINSIFCCQLYKIQGEEVTRLRNEAAKVGKVREQNVKKLTQAENQCQSLMQEKEMLKRVISHLEKDLHMAKKQAENNKRICDELQRDRDNLNKNILKAAGMVLLLRTVK
jgi:TolA-binding protein